MKYWNGEGKHQAEYDELREKLVPFEGYAPTEEGEMLRCLSNVYYDVYNNGGGNLRDTRLADLCGLVYFLHKTEFDLTETCRLHGLTLKTADGVWLTETDKAMRDHLLDKAADWLIANVAGVPA